MVEKAVEVLKSASRAVGQPDGYILNRLGMYYDELGDLNRMELHYAEAARWSGNWGGPLFNWALHHKRRKNFPVALEKVDDDGILRQPDPHHLYFARPILRRFGPDPRRQGGRAGGLLHFPPALAVGPVGVRAGLKTRRPSLAEPTTEVGAENPRT